MREKCDDDKSNFFPLEIRYYFEKKKNISKAKIIAGDKKDMFTT